MRNKLALIGAGFLAGVALTFVTFTSVAQPVAADQAENAYMLAQKAQVAHAIYQLDSSGLHGIDDGAKAGTIPPGALGAVRRARISVQAAEWPDALKDMAMEQVTAMKTLEEALRTEAPTKVAEPAAKVHDGGHELSDAVYGWL